MHHIIRRRDRVSKDWSYNKNNVIWCSMSHTGNGKRKTRSMLCKTRMSFLFFVKMLGNTEILVYVPKLSPGKKFIIINVCNMSKMKTKVLLVLVR